ncbi:uncharacterized protein EV420DRAFT_769394 [Desarmillaria tabescens]|uniref:Uncharacterized protein n=1 Tax=Armillaria tabescens TaxID=1929756 RepID=A0AA39IYZ0_ARMTA|nr:uncharacterized protein EV420DRAFT_769394 [Desarmillaria tabescens]KAK0431754.1 hypothetical protein EV420DRAFT_769394 [Desarmillaria tabescens]
MCASRRTRCTKALKLKSVVARCTELDVSLEPPTSGALLISNAITRDHQDPERMRLRLTIYCMDVKGLTGEGIPLAIFMLSHRDSPSFRTFSFLLLFSGLLTTIFRTRSRICVDELDQAPKQARVDATVSQATDSHSGVWLSCCIALAVQGNISINASTLLCNAALSTCLQPPPLTARSVDTMTETKTWVSILQLASTVGEIAAFPHIGGVATCVIAFLEVIQTAEQNDEDIQELMQNTKATMDVVIKIAEAHEAGTSAPHFCEALKDRLEDVLKEIQEKHLKASGLKRYFKARNVSSAIVNSKQQVQRIKEDFIIGVATDSRFAIADFENGLKDKVVCLENKLTALENKLNASTISMMPSIHLESHRTREWKQFYHLSPTYRPSVPTIIKDG